MNDKFNEPSIDGFCQRKGISRGSFYNLRKAGKAPRQIYVGTRVVITPEAERDWDREREAEAEVERQARDEKRAAARAKREVSKNAIRNSNDGDQTDSAERGNPPHRPRQARARVKGSRTQK